MCLLFILFLSKPSRDCYTMLKMFLLVGIDLESFEKCFAKCVVVIILQKSVLDEMLVEYVFKV